MAPMKPSATCHVEVVAFDAGSKKHIETFSVPVAQPLKTLRQKWAQVFRIPDTSVGFEDSTQSLVDMQSSPLELSWGDRVTLQAVPLDEQWAADGILDEQDVAAEEISAKLEAGEGAAAVTLVGSGRGSSSGDTAASDAASASASASPTGLVIACAQGQKRPAPPPLPALPRTSLAKNTSPCPAGHDPIIFDQDNPKRLGSAAYDRYDMYKQADTPNEALLIGAELRDIRHDFRKGYLRRR